MKHFLTIDDYSTDELKHILKVARELRAERQAGKPNEPVLKNQTLAMFFEKPSLRTRVSFQQAMIELGGNGLYLTHQEVGLGERESAGDVARVLSGMVHGIMARVFAHKKLEALAEHATVPVINALSDDSHPCQALADIMTVQDDFGESLEGRTITFVGDGNNVARSLGAICMKLGIHFTLASPKGYTLSEKIVEDIQAMNTTVKFTLTDNPTQAVKNADAIYADTFVSMGQEEEKSKRLEIFKDYQINADLLSHAPDHAIVLHCLPAYRGIEITDEVMDGKQSRVFPQAHNRLHAQKGLLAVLMGGR